MKKICFITNYASHYHLAKWQLLAKTFEIDFVFEHDISKTKGIEQMDLSKIDAKTLNVKNYFIQNHMIWQSGVIKLAFSSDYDKYIITEEITCISSWIVALIVKLSKHKKLYRGDGHSWYGKEGVIKRLIKKMAFHMSVGEFVYGNYAKNIMIKNGLDKNKIWVVHNSLNHAEQLKFRGNITDIYKNHFANENPVLIFVGRLIDSKRLDMNLLALDYMRQKGFHCNFVFVGEGEMKTELMNDTISRNLDQYVWFYGASYSEQEISELITNADICVSPGNIGLTAMHSLVYGTPVITSNDFTIQGPEFEAVKSGVTGDFFTAGCVDDLSQKIMLWLQTHTDREQIRENCYAEIDNYWTPEFKVNVIRNALYNNV